MSQEITTAMVEQYKANIELLSQQKGSRLRNAVRIETVVGENAFFDQIAATTAQVKTTRHMDTPQTDTPHARRRVSLTDYVWADFVDKEDLVRTLIDPTSPYAINAVNAFGRAMDDVIIAAALGTAWTGKAGAVPLTITESISEGNTGLTIDKLIQAKGKFWANDVEEDEELFICVRGKQLEDLLATTQVTNSDYNTVKALVKGEVNQFMGFTFIRSQRISMASAIASCFAWARSGIALGLGADIHTRISERADKNYLTQVWCGMTIGATRMEEVKVVQIDCDENPT